MFLSQNDRKWYERDMKLINTWLLLVCYILPVGVTFLGFSVRGILYLSIFMPQGKRMALAQLQVIIESVY